MSNTKSKKLKQFCDHPTSFENNVYAYPVVSRRSHGISLGVNLNPDKVCNFDCIYCQVDRNTPAPIKKVDDELLLKELQGLLIAYRSGELFEHPMFQDLPEKWRSLKSIAFAGDGEPTSYRRFPEIVQSIIDMKQTLGVTEGALVVITNATLFDREPVQRALELIAEDGGEIWAKLDAGTEEYYHQVERTSVSFNKVLNNILEAARVRPIVIQSMFMNIELQPPTSAEIVAYCDRLNEMLSEGAQFNLVQIYTIARDPAESSVTPLSDQQVDELAQTVRENTGLTVESFYGA
ncbi:MAG: radical SAM protein [Planctomycetaceae bacterium]|nr:radical SAM protein [Planctomycetaceae bacterium]